MTRTRRLQGPAHDGTSRLGFREDLRLELVHPRRRVEPLRTQAREPRILGGALGAFLDRLDEGEERLRVADATPEQPTRMVVEGDECSGLLLEGLGDLNRASGAPQDVGVEGLARNAN